MSAHPIPTRRLPRQPNLEQLRKQAKDLHAQRPDWKLSDAQRELARAYGFASWPKLKAFVDGSDVARLAATVNAGDRAAVQAMLAARPELVHMDRAANDEHRALHYAVLRRDEPMVRLLMRAGADARKGIFPHRDATTALTLARDREFADIVAAIEEEEQQHATQPAPHAAAEPTLAPAAIHAAIEAGDGERVRQLVRADPGVLARPIDWRRGGLLTLAVRHGDIAMLRLLLDLGMDPNERTTLEELEEPTVSQGTPLWLAAANGRLDLAQLLLDRGADPNGNPYASGWPLDHAWRRGDEAMKQLLLARGAHPQPWTVTLAHDLAAARRMLAEGGEETARELVWSAACNACPEIVEMALPRLAWPRDDPRWNWILIQPPRSAGENGVEDPYFRSLELLLARVDPNVTARFGQRALHYVAARATLSEAARVRFTEMLLDAGARLDLRDELLRSTPLGWACRWGRPAMVKSLLARGASPEEPDAEPWATPVAWARKMGHQDVMEALRSV